MKSEPLRWIVRPNAQLSWRQWDDEFVVYHGASGQTHYLNLFAALALQLLAERPATAEEVAGEIQHMANNTDAIPGTEQIPMLIEQFADLGLIGPLSP